MRSLLFVLLAISSIGCASIDSKEFLEKDKIFKDAEHFADIIYVCAHDAVYNRDYLKEILKKKPYININMVFLEHLAFFMFLCDRASNFILDKNDRKLLAFSIYEKITEYISESSNESEAKYIFTNFYNVRIHEYSNYDYFLEKDAKIIFNDENIPKFINMDKEVHFEFTKIIMNLLEEPIESFLGWKIYNSAFSFDEIIIKEVCKRFEGKG